MKSFILVLVSVGVLCSTAFAQPKWLERAQQLEQQFGRRASVTALSLIHPQKEGDATTLACGRADGTVTIFDREDSRVLTQHNLGEAVPIAFSPRGDTIVSLHSDKWENDRPIITLWDMQSGEKTHSFTPNFGKGSLSQIMAVAFSPNGATLAVAGGYFYFQGVELWDVKTGEFLRALERIPGDSGASNGADAVVFSPDGRNVAATSYISTLDGGIFRGKAIGLWDVTTGKWQRTMQLRRSFSSAAIAWGIDGNARYIVDTDGKNINTFDPQTGEWNATREWGQDSHPSRRQSVGGSDDTLVLVSTWDNLFLTGNGSTITVWSSHRDNMRLYSTITSPITITRAIFIGRDTVAGGFADGTVRLWRIQEKRQENP